MDHDPRQDQSLAKGQPSSPSAQSQLRPVRQTRFFSAPPYNFEAPTAPAPTEKEFGRVAPAAGSAFSSGAAPRPSASSASAFSSVAGPQSMGSMGSMASSSAAFASDAAPQASRSMSREYPGIARSFEGESFTMPVSGPVTSPCETKPLRLIHVGPCFMNGGVEQQTLSLAKFFDPRRIDFVKCLVTNPELLSERAAAAMPIPVEYCAPPTCIASPTSAMSCCSGETASTSGCGRPVPRCVSSSRTANRGGRPRHWQRAIKSWTMPSPSVNGFGIEPVAVSLRR